jgi:hypothetical protein
MGPSEPGTEAETSSSLCGFEGCTGCLGCGKPRPVGDETLMYCKILADYVTPQTARICDRSTAIAA